MIYEFLINFSMFLNIELNLIIFNYKSYKYFKEFDFDDNGRL